MKRVKKRKPLQKKTVGTKTIGKKQPNKVSSQATGIIGKSTGNKVLHKVLQAEEQEENGQRVTVNLGGGNFKEVWLPKFKVVAETHSFLLLEHENTQGLVHWVVDKHSYFIWSATFSGEEKGRQCLEKLQKKYGSSWKVFNESVDLLSKSEHLYKSGKPTRLALRELFKGEHTFSIKEEPKKKPLLTKKDKPKKEEPKPVTKPKAEKKLIKKKSPHYMDKKKDKQKEETKKPKQLPQSRFMKNRILKKRKR
jgi:hypothetical protein